MESTALELIESLSPFKFSGIRSSKEIQLVTLLELQRLKQAPKKVCIFYSAVPKPPAGEFVTKHLFINDLSLPLVAHFCGRLEKAWKPTSGSLSAYLGSTSSTCTLIGGSKDAYRAIFRWISKCGNGCGECPVPTSTTLDMALDLLEVIQFLDIPQARASAIASVEKLITSQWSCTYRQAGRVYALFPVGSQARALIAALVASIIGTETVLEASSSFFHTGNWDPALREDVGVIFYRETAVTL
ncbi:MAG: hypothetical protein M1834_009149 [Cirrosporium novae-zelandiae]|nr:MAG: hypothetical protein M1834_009149 [Cirrosporium novae-zelandiae]